MKKIHEKEKTIHPSSIINLQFVFERALDGVVDPETILHLIDQTIELYQMPSPNENAIELLLYLGESAKSFPQNNFSGRTHEHAFGTMDVFNKLRELLKSENRTLLRCGLELMSILGHLLDGVVDIELKSSADDSVSSDSMGEDIVKAG